MSMDENMCEYVAIDCYAWVTKFDLSLPFIRYN